MERLAAEGGVREVVELGQAQHRVEEVRGEGEVEQRGVVQAEVEGVQVEVGLEGLVAQTQDRVVIE